MWWPAALVILAGVVLYVLAEWFDWGPSEGDDE